jgi:hypothetical protein
VYINIKRNPTIAMSIALVNLDIRNIATSAQANRSAVRPLDR